MILRMNEAYDHPVHLLAVNGDRIGINSGDLARFLSCRPFLMFGFAYCVLLVIHNSQVYGVEAELWFRMVFYPVNTAIWGLIWLTQFWLLERLALRKGVSFVALTMVIHAVPVAITVYLGASLVTQYYGEAFPSTYSMISYGLKMFVLGLSFEFFVVQWVWPGVTGLIQAKRDSTQSGVGTYAVEIGEFIDSANEKFTRKS